MNQRSYSPHIALSREAHDRIADRRVDAQWFEQTWADPATRVLVVAGTRLRPVAGAEAWVSPAEAPDGVPVLLGERAGIAHFAVVAGPEAGSDDWVPLRGALSALDEETGALVVHAVGIAEWLWTTRYCPRCGGPLAPEQLGHLLRCEECGRSEFPRTDPAVIMLVVDGDGPDDRCLLGRHPRWPEGRYSTLAGFVEPGESMEQAVRREVLEETGVRVDEVTYFGSQPWPLPRSLMVGFTARAANRAEALEISVDGEEIEDARWFSREEMRAEAEAGTLFLPGGISISRSLVESWYGGSLAGHW